MTNRAQLVHTVDALNDLARSRRYCQTIKKVARAPARGTEKCRSTSPASALVRNIERDVAVAKIDVGAAGVEGENHGISARVFLGHWKLLHHCT